MIRPLKIKDPIFGYIPVDDDDLYAVINSAMFHRLQDIIQTSYSSVYPSAVHNRFTHSLGVYYLGRIAAEKISADIINQQLTSEEELKSIKKSFILACLMHDIGHSPFSHTGEKFYFQYIDDSKIPSIWKELMLSLNEDKQFISDSDGNNKTKGAEHEIMSALVSLKNFPEIFKNLDKSFFVRCIIGLKYSEKNEVKNCFIELLNSKTIDVDKLDYLIRDSFLTGFKSINIDYERLLNAVCVIKNKNEGVCLGFEKAALSTLESVILAHDMERKWIQNHPVIKYECYLVSYMISKAQSAYDSKQIKLFSPESLSDKGVAVKQDRICLLSDSDITAFAKKLYPEDKIIKEYFDRSFRKKALWKSESEYRILFERRGLQDKVLTQLEDLVCSLENLLLNKFEIPLINNEALEYLESERKGDFLPDNIRKSKEKELKKLIEFVNILRKYAENVGIPFEFVIVSASQFATGFNKPDLKNIKVRFSDNSVEILNNILYLFTALEPRKNFFYLYTTGVAKQKIDTKNLTYEIVKFILEKFNSTL